jgi:type I restriction enzyme S subunit
MSDWKEVKIGEIADLLQGLAINAQTSHMLVEKNGLPLLRIKDLIENTSLMFINPELAPKGCLVSENDLIMTRTGQVGYVFMGKSGVLHNNSFKIVPKSKEVSSRFLYCYFNNATIQDNLTSIAAGSAQPDLTHKIFKEYTLLLPPIQVQEDIAEVLMSLEDKMTLLNTNNKTIEELIKAKFSQLFINEIETKPLMYFGKIICGKTPSKNKSDFFNGPIPFLKIPDMHGKTFIFKTKDSLTEMGKKSQLNKTIPPFSISVSCIATVGLVTINAFECQTNQQINSIIPNKEYFRYFLFNYFKSITDDLVQRASSGSVTHNLNTGDFSNIEIPYFKENLLKSFDDSVSPLYQKIYNNEVQIQQLETLRNTLLPKLMSGAVIVK